LFPLIFTIPFPFLSSGLIHVSCDCDFASGRSLG
jgi:hypothetical protein